MNVSLGAKSRSRKTMAVRIMIAIPDFPAYNTCLLDPEHRRSLKLHEAQPFPTPWIYSGIAGTLVSSAS